MVSNIKKLTDNVEDVERPLIIIKRRLVQAVDFQPLLWEDSMDGAKSWEQEEVRELEECHIKKTYPEELKTDLEAVQHPNQFKERPNDF